MPLVNYSTNFIEIEVTDRIVADTIIKQKALFISLNHTQTSAGCLATILVRVTLYANDNGAYGEPLTGPGFSPYNVTLVADNNTLVAALSGEIVAVRANENDALWLAIAELHEKTVMFQGDFFEMLRDTQAVRIGDMIRLHINNANEQGRFS